MRSKKGAVELSMSMLVVIILSMVILAGGITLLFKFFNMGEKVKADLDDQTREELDRLVTDEGQQVALPRNRVTIQRGENHIFGVGILNTNSNERDFKVEIELDSVLVKDLTTGKEIPITDEQINLIKQNVEKDWLLYYNTATSLKQGENTIQKIQVTVPNDAQEGTYIFNVRVKVGDTQYGNTQKMYVKAT